MEDVKYVTLSSELIVTTLSRRVLTLFYASIDCSRQQIQLCDNCICRAVTTPLTDFIALPIKAKHLRRTASALYLHHI